MGCKKKYNPIKGVNNMNRMLLTETIGTTLAFKVAGSDTNALNVASIGTSLAGIPSLTYGTSNVINSLGMLEQKSGKKKKRGW